MHAELEHHTRNNSTGHVGSHYHLLTCACVALRLIRAVRLGWVDVARVVISSTIAVVTGRAPVVLVPGLVVTVMLAVVALVGSPVLSGCCIGWHAIGRCSNCTTQDTQERNRQQLLGMHEPAFKPMRKHGSHERERESREGQKGRQWFLRAR